MPLPQLKLPVAAAAARRSLASNASRGGGAAAVKAKRAKAGAKRQPTKTRARRTAKVPAACTQIDPTLVGAKFRKYLARNTATLEKEPERPAEALARLTTVAHDAAVTLSSGVFTDATAPFMDAGSLQRGGRGYEWDPSDVRAFSGVVGYSLGASVVAVPAAELAVTGTGASEEDAESDGGAAAVAACAPSGAATAPDDGSSSSDNDE